MQPHLLGNTPAHGAHSLQTFADCVRLALLLASDFDHAHVAAITDPDGIVVDGVVLSDPAHTIHHAAGYALCLEQACGTGAHVVFFTVSNHRAHQVSQDDLTAWSRMKPMFTGAAGCHDWFITDGQCVRSMAMTADPDQGWPPIQAAAPNTSTSANKQAGEA